MPPPACSAPCQVERGHVTLAGGIFVGNRQNFPSEIYAFFLCKSIDNSLFRVYNTIRTFVLFSEILKGAQYGPCDSSFRFE